MSRAASVGAVGSGGGARGVRSMAIPVRRVDELNALLRQVNGNDVKRWAYATVGRAGVKLPNGQPAVSADDLARARALVNHIKQAGL